MPTWNDINISQCISEIEMIRDLVKERNIENALEIGMAHGGTLQIWRDYCKGKIIGVDLPQAEIFHENNLDKFKSCYLIEGNSHDPKTLERVKNILGDEKLGMLYIDGDHSYIGVKKDFEMYSPLVRNGGLIILHDTNNDYPQDTGYGQVKKFWNELKPIYKYVEINHHFQWSEGKESVGFGMIIYE